MPAWNEHWRVKNVPAMAELQVEVLDKDETLLDGYVGRFKTPITPGTKKVTIEGRKSPRGIFWLTVRITTPPNRKHNLYIFAKIDSVPATDANPSDFPYLFDGPIRYSQHFSPAASRFTQLDEARLYGTWKMYLRGVPLFFGKDHQHWNRNYRAAQTIFQGPTSLAVRSVIQAGHRILYARTGHDRFGIIESGGDIVKLFKGGRSSRPGIQNSQQFADRLKPAVYTYIISSEDDSLRFSETGAAFFVDFASKHALHSNCAQTVRYAGEFHPRPKCGWQNFTDDQQDKDVEWEMVMDNNSGTYSPDPKMLPKLKELLEYNFPGFTFVVLEHGDPKLEESSKACREYAVNNRGVKEDELQPHTNPGEATLSHQAKQAMTEKAEDPSVPESEVETPVVISTQAEAEEIIDGVSVGPAGE